MFPAYIEGGNISTYRGAGNYRDLFAAHITE